MRGAFAIGLSAVIAPGCFDLAGFDDFTFRPPLNLRLSGSKPPDKLDLLLVVDNSFGLADVQAVLSQTFLDFFERLANPPCLDINRNPVPVAGPLEACPSGTARESPPLLDIHVGIITSSLGDHGGDVCESASGDTKAHLERGSPDQSYDGKGFLVWDPSEVLIPPGDSQVEVLVDRVSTILGGLDQQGCGYEAPLEAMYRFLNDPNPYETLVVDGATSKLDGTDSEVLTQRAEFLRPDSIVAIVLISDENDCSFVDGAQSHLLTRAGPLSSAFNARAACALSPADPCCTSCALPPGEGCDTSKDECDAPVVAHPNLRCFDQKRRFGFDFLYPVERYERGLTSPTVEDRDGNEVLNPLFAGGRDPNLVLLTALVGVPWHDIARRDKDLQPDLLAGLDASGEPTGGVLNADELVKLGAWELIAGEPTSYVPPADPFMIESSDRREGKNPITDTAITGPEGPQNEINGFDFEQEEPAEPSALQYACIARLPTPIQSSECASNVANPICVGNDRVAHAASPGLRQLELVRRLGPRGAVGSVCWAQVDNPEADDFGYRPALLGSAQGVGGLAGALQNQLRGQSCVSEQLPVDSNDNVQCEIVEALVTVPGECNCEAPARRRSGDADADTIERARADEFADPNWNCFCFLQQAQEGLDRRACESYVSQPVVNEFGGPVDAWCYVDATTNPPLGEPSLVSACPEKRAVRFVGDALPRPRATVFIDCP
jgi:hypothetical protein